MSASENGKQVQALKDDAEYAQRTIESLCDRRLTHRDHDILRRQLENKRDA